MENYEVVREDLGTGNSLNFITYFFRFFRESMSSEAPPITEVDGMEADQLWIDERKREAITNKRGEYSQGAQT